MIVHVLWKTYECYTGVAKHLRLAIKGRWYIGCLAVIARFLSSLDFSLDDFYPPPLPRGFHSTTAGCRFSCVALIWRRLENSRASVSTCLELRSIRLHFIIRSVSPDAYAKQTQHHPHIHVGEGKADVKEGLHCTFNVQICTPISHLRTHAHYPPLLDG